MKGKLLKILAVLGCLTLTAGFASCGGNDDGGNANGDSNSNSSESSSSVVMGSSSSEEAENKEPFSSEGLKYKLNETEDSYSVTGCEPSATRVAIPSAYKGLPVTSIGERAFDGCYILTEIVIPDSVTSIGDYAFWWCGALTEIVIPDSVTSIGDSAFEQCSSLTEIVIPNSVTGIGEYAFDECVNLKSVYITDLVAWCNISFAQDLYDSCSSNPLLYAENLYVNNELVTEVTIPYWVTRFGIAFHGFSGLKSVAIGNGVTRIDEYAFSNCDNLTSVTIGDSVTRIDEYAFAGCSSLTEIVIPDSVTTIGEYVFYGCKSLTIYCEKGSGYDWTGDWGDPDCPVVWDCKNREIANDGCTYRVVDGIRYGLRGDALKGAFAVVVGQPTNITVANILEYFWYNQVKYEVTHIAEEAFYNCSSLTEIVIPDSITSIEAKVFYGCSSLTEIVIPDSVRGISDHAFFNCSSLTEIVIPDSVRGIGDYAFYKCSSLTEIVIPDSVTSIGDYAFWWCSALTEIVIPDSVTTIGEHAFDGCNSLTIYCEHEGEDRPPHDWDLYWNDSNSPVYWYSEKEPNESGNYWRYNDEGEIEIWN